MSRCIISGLVFLLGFFVSQSSADSVSPLFLTPYINSGQIQKGQELAQVLYDEFGDVESYSGYLTVNETFNSNLFFWFFPAQNGKETAPVLVWLEGGPGATTMLSLFKEIGPFAITQDLHVKLRNITWIKDFSLIFIDNPVGTGFSFTENEQGYVHTEEEMADNLYEALIQFFQLFPEYQSNDFFLTGDSYAGKYIPAMGRKIHSVNPFANQKINLKGLAIGNGLIDPINQMNYSDYLYMSGMIDLNTKHELTNLQNELVRRIENQLWYNATALFDYIIDTYLYNRTGLDEHFNYLETFEGDNQYEDFIIMPDVRKAIHAGTYDFNASSDVVDQNLYEDQMQSIVAVLEDLLDYYPVLLYNGQIDIVCNYPNMENFIQKMSFNGSEEYARASREIWKMENDSNVSGYVKVANLLTEVLVIGAGHFVPKDQPERAFDLISRFIRNKSFF